MQSEQKKCSPHVEEMAYSPSPKQTWQSYVPSSGSAAAAAACSAVSSAHTLPVPRHTTHAPAASASASGAVEEDHRAR